MDGFLSNLFVSNIVWKWKIAWKSFTWVAKWLKILQFFFCLYNENFTSSLFAVEILKQNKSFYFASNINRNNLDFWFKIKYLISKYI